jgi:hypothetical protein
MDCQSRLLGSQHPLTVGPKRMIGKGE